MSLSKLTLQATEWLRGVGPMHDVVISSRVRLARNLAGMPFRKRCNETQTAEIQQRLRDVLLGAKLAPDLFYVDLAAADELDRELLVERHLISRQHAESTHPRGVAISGDETIAMMVNEEDHLRMQVLRSGLQLHEAFDEIRRVDDALEQRLDFAFSSRFGYLTACPTNVGTGLRVSVMLHLPALKLTGEIEKALRAASDMRMAIRGLYGEGTEALGDFFQISNQVTLGRNEDQIIQEFITLVVPELLQYERTAREALLEHNPTEVDDHIFRALGILKSARKITAKETIALLSMIRLGVNLKRINDVSLQTVNELFLLAQKAHLQKVHGKTLDEHQRSQLRAELIRQRLSPA